MERQTRRAQSAMEYLMTYGWAILIIAVVLVALFSLGVFKPSSGSSCLGQPGFICQSAIYTPTGNIVATVGQATGTNWATANVGFVSQTAASNAIPTFSAGYNAIGTLSSGQTAAITVAATGNVVAGTSISGTLWAWYTVSGSSGSNYYVEIASVNLNAQ